MTMTTTPAASAPVRVPADVLRPWAARMLQAQSRTTLGADIWLTKVLPMGGGIGGGSSDAATRPGASCVMPPKSTRRTKSSPVR